MGFQKPAALRALLWGHSHSRHSPNATEGHGDAGQQKRFFGAWRIASLPALVPSGEPQLLFLARETKMEATDTDSPYDTGGALPASPVGVLDKTQRKVQEGFLSSKVTVLCGPSSGHLPPQASWGLFSASGTARSVPRTRPAQAVLSAVYLQPHWQGPQSQKHILRSFSFASPWLLIQYRAHHKSGAMNISGSKEKTFPCFQV